MIHEHVLVRLLHYANSHPPMIGRREFYALKYRLLKRYATQDWYDMQHIVRECYGWNFLGCDKDKTCKCRGTGIYIEKWIPLRRYEWKGFRFHIPESPLLRRPDSWSREIIEGLVKHANYGKASGEALLWILLICGEFRLFARQMKSTCWCGWTWLPLVNLQKLTFWARCMFERRTCYCGKRFTAWGSGWCVCRKCRGARVENPPF